MLYYDTIDLSEVVDIGKSNKSKEWVICQYCFFNQWFNFQDSGCNGCNDLTILSPNISGIAIIAVEGVNYRCIIHDIIKAEAIYLLENSVLDDRGYT